MISVKPEYISYKIHIPGVEFGPEFEGTNVDLSFTDERLAHAVASLLNDGLIHRTFSKEK